MSYSQTVGVVLSGGGATAAAHVGFLRALEEENIPIDYIAGTSMGAVVGGYYA
ncbi:MAG: patatin-like phospholipase family protein, partial [Flavobacteriales bacterium]